MSSKVGKAGESSLAQGAVSQLLALEAQLGIRGQSSSAEADRRLLRQLHEQPLPVVFDEQAVAEQTSELRKRCRLLLSRHFLADFWRARGGELIANARALAASHFGSKPAHVLTAMQRHFSISERALALPGSESLLSALAEGLRLLFSEPAPPAGVQQLELRLRALSLPLVAGTWFAAVDWQCARSESAPNTAWSNYSRLLSDVSEHYASPAAHYRAGVEGYLALLNSLIVHVAESLPRPGSVTEFVERSACSLLMGLSRVHMLSLAALDEECRAAPEPIWRDGQGVIPDLEARALERILRRMRALAGRSNTAGKNRMGCPFTTLGPAFRQLHSDAFVPLARRWLGSAAPH